MNRGRLVAVAVGAAVLVGAVVVLRSGVQAPAPPAVSPDGERIAAYHDPVLVTPPQRPTDRPSSPGRLHTDARHDGLLVSWPPAPFGFEVRWGPAGADPGNVRFVAGPGTSLAGLAPGRYRVEVRSVDQVGRRSDPSTVDVEVDGQEPPWRQGLGFVEDFTVDGDLRPDRWWVNDPMRDCVRRDHRGGPLILAGHCGGSLRPVSPLVLSDPGADGVRGRVVVVADTPPPPPNPQGVPDEPPDGFGSSNDLHVVVAPWLPSYGVLDGIRLRISSRGAYLSTGGGSVLGPPPEQRLDVPSVGSPGALHRWELVFATGELRALRDGVPVGSIAYEPPWREAQVGIAAFVTSEGIDAPGPRIGLVGLTGPAPDGTVVELRDLGRQAYDPATLHRYPVTVPPTARSARLTGVVYRPSSAVDQPVPPPDVVAEVDGRPVDQRLQPIGNPHDGSTWFTAELPAGGDGGDLTLTLRSADGAPFAAYGLEVQVVHEPGTEVAARQPRVVRSGPPPLARPQLVLRSGQQLLTSAQPAPRGRLDVEVRLDSLAAQAATGELAGWVAIRVELGDRRILDFPTTADGPAAAGGYRFTLDTTDLPEGYHTLVVTVIPDRPAIPYGTDRFVVRLTG